MKQLLSLLLILLREPRDVQLGGPSRSYVGGRHVGRAEVNLAVFQLHFELRIEQTQRANSGLGQILSIRDNIYYNAIIRRVQRLCPLECRLGGSSLLNKAVFLFRKGLASEGSGHGGVKSDDPS